MAAMGPPGGALSRQAPTHTRRKVMSEPIEYSEEDTDEIAQLLVGHRIIKAEMGDLDSDVPHSSWLFDGPKEGTYRIYVIADAQEINVAEFVGSDGNGFYGTGFSLIVVPPDAIGEANR
jgi:hypothetical protein